jgi:hypothetical protein
MSCCGKGREAVRTGSAGPAAPAVLQGPATFQYLGPGSLTIFGRSTGRRYRFDQHGAIATVDARDAAALSMTLYLRRVP